MIPRSLDDWTLASISTLLAMHAHESEDFDLKERLPDKRDAKGKDRLREACCAFANSGGGYLIFGIKDDRKLEPKDRLIGISPEFDFPAKFGDFPALCHPSIYWVPRNPPLRLANGNVLHVIHVLESWKAPHAVTYEDSKLKFLKRTNKGTEAMSIEEVRSMFLNYHEKGLRLQLLDSELSDLHGQANSAYVDGEPDIEERYSLVTLSIQVIESVVSDTYSLTASSPALLSYLRRLCQSVTIANNKARSFYATATLSFSNKRSMIRDHNEFMKAVCTEIGEFAEKARTELQTLLAP